MYTAKGYFSMKIRVSGMKPGDRVNIPTGVKHWHGAAPGCRFRHLAVDVLGEDGRNEWRGPVDDAAYANAVK